MMEKTFKINKLYLSGLFFVGMFVGTLMYSSMANAYVVVRERPAATSVKVVKPEYRNNRYYYRGYPHRHYNYGAPRYYHRY